MKAHPSSELETDVHLIEHFTSQQIPRPHRGNLDRKMVARYVHNPSPGSNLHGHAICQAQGHPGWTRQNFSSDTCRNQKPALKASIQVGQINDVSGANGKAELDPRKGNLAHQRNSSCPGNAASFRLA